MNIERIDTRLIRWLWQHPNSDGSTTMGWTATKWGARRAIAEAEREDRQTQLLRAT